MKIINRVFIMALLSLFIYLPWSFLATKFNHVFISIQPNTNAGFATQTDFLFHWQTFVWSAFALLIGLINGYLIRGQDKRLLCHFLTYLLGLLYIACMDGLIAGGTTGLLAWCTGFEGKINLSFMSVILWPVVYFFSLAFMIFCSTRRRSSMLP